MEKLSGVNQGSGPTVPTGEKPEMLSALTQPQDVVSASQKPEAGKIKTLDDAAKMLQLEKKLRRLASKLNRLLRRDCEDHEASVKKAKLHTASNSEITENLIIGHKPNTSIAEGKEAFRNFKEGALVLLDGYDNLDSEKTSTILDDVIKLFKNSGFSKTISVTEDGVGFDEYRVEYLVGITTDKQMLGFSFLYIVP